jgi:YidC/Oxa1 family membrane protein insertase
MLDQDKDSQKNLVLAIALSLAVLLAWQFFYAGPRARVELEQRQAQAAAEKARQAGTATPAIPGAAPGAPTAPGTTVPGSTSAPSASPAAPAQMLSREAAIAGGPRVAIATPSLKGTINLKGGMIDDLSFMQYRETIKSDSANVVLFSPAGTNLAYFTEFGWIAVPGSGAKVPDSDTVWQSAAGATLAPGKPLTLTHDNGAGLVFKRTFTVDEKYMFTVRDEVENKTGRETALVPYSRIYRFGTPKVEGWAILHEGPIAWVGEERLQEVGYSVLTDEATKSLKEKKINEGTKSFKPAIGGWIGFTDKYWSAALIPAQDKPFDAKMQAMAKSAGQSEVYWTNVQSAPVVFASGQTAGNEVKLFAGAKQPKMIDAYGAQHGIARFDLMVDWGIFHFITKPLFWLIDKLYGLLGNFGLAILAVTVLVKGVFFPLQSKSYESMAKMKKLQPEMERIRKDITDRTQQQQALMEIYKKEKINPAAGCLPVLLQIPVFFALYKVLFVTIDMRHAPFFGWIKDLSAADPTSLFNLFGLLPFGVPEFLQVGVWPLIMGATMWLQMQLNPQQPDPIQQKLFNWMPVMFTFMLGTFPAGLVIYWAWSNILSLAQQYYITKKAGADIHIWKNIGLDRWFGGGTKT